jgi:hypothetical protein
MNLFTAATKTRLQAIASAFIVTLAMLGAIDGLATSQPQAALVAAIVAARA